MHHPAARAILAAFILLITFQTARADDSQPFAALAKSYNETTRPLVKQFCLKCHTTERQEGDLDLERFIKLDDVRRDTKVWQKVIEMLDNGEMPPKKSPQPTVAQRKELRTWSRNLLDAEALAHAGDPGAVLLRRLSNVEYNNTIRDLTTFDLKPAREFPVDGAAGEGFTNVGEALAMSPALLDKYVNASKSIAAHAVLLPDGFRFFAEDTRRDWTDELVGRIKDFYRRYSAPEGSRRVNLQGLDFLAEAGGRIPLESYLAATIVHRDDPKQSLESLATRSKLSTKYLQILWNTLQANQPSPILDPLRARWRTARPENIAALAGEIRLWQNALTKFNSVAHFKKWLEPLNPISEREGLLAKLPTQASGSEVVLSLVTRGPASKNQTARVVWEQPRLEAPERPPILLRDVRDGLAGLEIKKQTLKQVSHYLAAADEIRAKPKTDRVKFAREKDLDEQMLSAWLDYLGIGVGTPLPEKMLNERQEKGGGYPFISGWGSGGLPSILANSSDQEVKIPGTARPHGVVVHPSPTQTVAAGWRSAWSTTLNIQGHVNHAHNACGNGVAWTLELRRGSERRKLAGADVDRGQSSKIAPVNGVQVEPGDFITLIVSARGTDHSCDLTDIELILDEAAGAKRSWKLSRDVSSDILAGNPHADKLGNLGVWYFFTEASNDATSTRVAAIPRGSALDQWRDAKASVDQTPLATAIENLLRGAAPSEKSANAELYRQVYAINGPLLGNLDFKRLAEQGRAATTSKFGLPRDRFQDANLLAEIGSTVEIRLPAELCANRSLVSSVTLERSAPPEAFAQAEVIVGQAQAPLDLRPGPPVLVRAGTPVRGQLEKGFDEFRQIFPAALCYAQIVPVDEVVTLVLFHREDEPLQRLMLSDAETAQLNRLWDELRYISQDALRVQEAYGQFMEYVTQDGDVRIFEPLRKPIKERAEAFKKRMTAAEPVQLEALLAFAERAYRRPLDHEEQTGLRKLYTALRTKGLDHDAAFHLTLSRVLMAPSFLYHVEQSAAGTKSQPISDWELANRLSYFLWSSMPDAELFALAKAGKLHQPEVLATQAKRMLQDDRARALATEFACQWIDIRDFDTHNEKSETTFPTFLRLRPLMYEESVLFFTDLFKNNRSVLDVLDADYTFVNGDLAQFYGLPGVTGAEWRRVNGVKKHARGGILGMATLLAKQSGASRTSPILRGNWLLETLLGEKLPKPPKNVPQLPESELDTNGLTIRQITERHRADPACAKCHDKIDAFGMALEGFDPIGKRRSVDLAGRPIDFRAEMKDGSKFTDIDGLRDYVLKKRRDDYLTNFGRKFLGYALGRSVQLSDEPLIAEMKRTLAGNEYHVQSALQTIILSPQFLTRRGVDSPLDHDASNP